MSAIIKLKEINLEKKAKKLEEVDEIATTTAKAVLELDARTSHLSREHSGAQSMSLADAIVSFRQEMRAGFTNNDKRLRNLETAQKETNTRLGNLEMAQKETNTRLGGLETAQKETNTRLGNLESGLNETNSCLGNLENKMDRLQNEMRHIREETTGLLRMIVNNLKK